MSTVDNILKIVRSQGWSKDEMAQFIAQLEHESMSFKKTREISYSPQRAYEVFPKRFKTKEYAISIYNILGSDGLFEVMYSGKIGNNKFGDGAKYIGRGFLAITGKDNYRTIGKAMNLDLLNNPELLEEEDNAIKSAIEWWKINVKPSISSFNGDVATEKITRIVNGPAMLGLDKRKSFYNKWIKIV